MCELAEHFNKRRTKFSLIARFERPQKLDKARSIQSADLVQRNLSMLSEELTGNSRGVAFLRGRERSNHHRAKKTVHRIRGNDNARPGFANLATDDGIQPRQVDAESADYHVHSDWSNSFGNAAQSRSSAVGAAPCVAIATLNRWSQSALGCAAGSIMIFRPSTRKFASFVSPARWSTALERRTPLDLPI